MDGFGGGRFFSMGGMVVSLVLDVAAQVRNGGRECGDGAHGGG
jgi:hypothetical protein